MATYTVLNAMMRAMRLLRVLNIGDTPTAPEQQDMLDALNGLVDSWATYRLNIYTTSQEEFTLNPGQQAYEIGPNAADWVTQRPTFISGGSILFPGSTSNLERPVRVCTDEQWRMILTKNLTTNFVTDIWYDYGFSNPNSAAPDLGSGKVWCYPIPDATGQIILYLPVAVSQFTAVNQPLALPPGYKRALVTNLAIEIAPEFESDPSPALIAAAEESLANIQRANVRIDPLRCDPAVSRHQKGGGFNVYIGE